jgi:2-methylcitrate dehydratase PrpD
MRTLLTALIKAYEIQGCYQISNAFNAFGIDHVILVKLASAAVVACPRSNRGADAGDALACLDGWPAEQGVQDGRKHNSTERVGGG